MSLIEKAVWTLRMAKFHLSLPGVVAWEDFLAVVRTNRLTYLEFGVAEGNSLRQWYRSIAREGSELWGFDSWEGLPEEWNKRHPKGAFLCEKPDFPGVYLIEGLYQENLFLNLDGINWNNKVIVNIDSDLYSSAMCVLGLITPRLKMGDYIIFDEIDQPWHEFRAYWEWREIWNKPHKVVSRDGWKRVAIVLV